MDSLIAAAARALASGDPLGALKRVALRGDPPALALRGIAMAQLGELARARELIRQAARGFGAGEPVARARCAVAEAEVALVMRDLDASAPALEAAAATLETHGDHVNALHARLVATRRLVLLGQLGAAERALPDIAPHGLPPALLAAAELARAELALRSLRSLDARIALQRALQAARQSAVPALVAEVGAALAALERPAARCLCAGAERALRIDEVEAQVASGALVVDGCRRGLRGGELWLPLVGRPVLFALLAALARAWPQDVERHVLIAEAFGMRRPDETHRARLRVEIGRLRALVKPLARVEASRDGFAIEPLAARELVVLLPPIEGDGAALLALLADGCAWSTSALALALGTSQRTLQRTLAGLEAAARVRSIGRARARRWLAPPLTGFTTNLLLPALLPLG